MRFLPTFAIGIMLVIIYEIYRSGAFNRLSTVVPSLANPGSLPVGITPSSISDPNNPANSVFATGIPIDGLLAAINNGTDVAASPSSVYGDVTGIGTAASNEAGFLVGD